MVIASLLVAAALLLDAGACAAATPPDPVDPTSLDVVLSGAGRLSARQLHELRQETSRLWAACAVALEWPADARASRLSVRARIEWIAREGDVNGRSLVLGWIDMAHGLPANGAIAVSAVAAAELARQATLADRAMQPVPAALSDRLLIRILSRALAHEIGHYLHGPEHADAGLMRARVPLAQLVDPAPARCTLSRRQMAVTARRDPNGAQAWPAGEAPH